MQTEENKTIIFTTVDVEEFFTEKHTEEHDDETFSTDIIVLTPEERKLVNSILRHLKIFSPETMEGIASRIMDLERLATTIARFPSLFGKQVITKEVRSEQTLIDSLLQHRDGDRMLHLPSKATLGKGFIVAKYHAFAVIAKVAHQLELLDEEVISIRTSTITLMFTIMAEDVYLNLLEDMTIDTEVRRKIAQSLIMLWEHRNDKNVVDIAPVLDAVWKVRDKLTPAFGTMVGTSELLLLSIELDENWRQFIKSELGNKDVSMALEEFLFGLPYESIQKIRHQLREGGISAVNKADIEEFGVNADYCNTETDMRNFYILYSIRRDNARARKRLNLEGPKKTLEDHFMRFILEKKS